MEGPSRAAVGGWLLVALQGVLLVGLVFWPASIGPVAPRLLPLAAACALLGLAGAVASAVYLGRALTPHPQPNGAGMSAKGVYRLARHPMYTSVILLAVAVAAARASLVVWGLAVAIYVFFEFKTRVEERWLLRAYPGYGAYAARTGKFLPGIGRRGSDAPDGTETP